MNFSALIDSLADRLAESFVRALEPKLAALVDEQIGRARKELEKLAEPVTEPLDSVSETLRRFIP